MFVFYVKCWLSSLHWSPTSIEDSAAHPSDGNTVALTDGSNVFVRHFEDAGSIDDSSLMVHPGYERAVTYIQFGTIFSFATSSF